MIPHVVELLIMDAFLSKLNFVDLIILLVFFFYALEGITAGFIISLFDLLSFVGSFAIGLTFYSFFAKLIVLNFAIPQGFANAFGFFIAAALSELALNAGSHFLFAFLRGVVSKRVPSAYLVSANRLFGFVPGMLSAFILLSFLLTLAITLPISPMIKRAISQSTLGNGLIANTQGFEKAVNRVFGGAVSETITFLTVRPQTNEFINLNFRATSLSVDSQSEGEMLVLINRERVSRGLLPLAMDAKLRELARTYSKDMLTRGYFSHYSKEGASPFDRMANANIPFGFAGENLALAPNVTLAHQGLMDSEGHRANILSPNFRRVGIGAIDGGIYGVMFVQEFTD